MKIPQYLHDPKFLENYRMFKDFYTNWKKHVTVFVPPHPYKQFEKHSEDDAEKTDNVPDHNTEETEEEKPKYRKSKENMRDGRVYPKKFSNNQDENDGGRKFKPKKFVSRRKMNNPRREYDEGTENFNDMQSDDEGEKEEYRR